MIRRSIILCVLFLAMWHLVLPLLGGRHRVIPGLQRQNTAKVQHYLHEPVSGKAVIVGSSMADRLHEVQLGGDHVKLTFPAGGALTGLEIVRRAGRTPEVCWIETNMILRGVDEQLVAEAEDPWWLRLRESSPMFRETGRPSGFGIGLMRDGLRRMGVAAQSLEPGAAEREAFLEETRKRLATAPSAQALATAIDRLAQEVERLGRAGCECVFFEMPIDARLRNLAEPAAVREAVRQRFPDTTFRWFTPVAPEEWRTTDGIHLTQEHAATVASQMKDFEQKLSPTRNHETKRLAHRF